jgi:(p)ppGpp synthase/HD superfamily hydrolase
LTRLGEAIALASDVHLKQMDKAGAPYILHPLEVMQRATSYYVNNSDGWKLEDVQIVAVLHDVLEDIHEDHRWERDRLRERIGLAFGKSIHDAVDAITKAQDRAETYEEYLGRVEANWMARIVKIADLSHNLDAFRIPSSRITTRDYERWDKYHRALVRLLRGQ